MGAGMELRRRRCRLVSGSRSVSREGSAARAGVPLLGLRLRSARPELLFTAVQLLCAPAPTFVSQNLTAAPILRAAFCTVFIPAAGSAPEQRVLFFIHVTTVEINSILAPTSVLRAPPRDEAVRGGERRKGGCCSGTPGCHRDLREQRGRGCGEANTEGCAQISMWQRGGDAWGAGCEPGAVSSPHPVALRGQTVLRKHRRCALRPGSSRAGGAAGGAGGIGGGGGGGAAPNPVRRPQAVAVRSFSRSLLSPHEAFAPQLLRTLQEPRAPRWSFGRERREPSSHGDALRTRSGAGRAPHGRPRPLPDATRLPPRPGPSPRPQTLRHPLPRARPVLTSCDRRRPRTAAELRVPRGPVPPRTPQTSRHGGGSRCAPPAPSRRQQRSFLPPYQRLQETPSPGSNPFLEGEALGRAKAAHRAANIDRATEQLLFAPC